MARPIWNGILSFGLLNVPVQLFSGERSVDLHFRMLDSRDQNPIRYERVNAETGEEVPWKEIVKAFEYSKGNYVVIDEEEMRSAVPAATETVEIEAFVDREEISPLYFERPYYLVPGKKAEKAYVLLREVLRKSNKVGIAKVVIRTRQYLSALMPMDNALVLDLMRFSQEIVAADEFKLPGAASEYRISPKEMEMATQLLESMTTQWKPEDYRDDFRDTLRKLIDARVAKRTGKKIKAVEAESKAAPGATTNVVDFMSLLKKSLAAKGKEAPSKKTRAAPRKRSHSTRQSA